MGYYENIKQFAKDFNNPEFLKKYTDMGGTISELKSLGEQIGQNPRNYHQIMSEYETMLIGRQKTQELETKLEQRYEMLSDPTSSFYKTFRSSFEQQIGRVLEKTTPTTQSLLALGLSSGLGYKAATRVASEQREASEAKSRDYATGATKQATSDIFLQMQGQAGQSLGMGLQANQFSQNMAFNYAQSAEQRRQYEESKPTFLDQLLGAGLSVGSYALGQKLAK